MPVANSTRFTFVLIGLISVLSSPVGAVDFDTEIMPILTRSGCNAGSCHGAAAGRGGFKLSLLGGDPAADYEEIVIARKGRRVNLARVSESLILAKTNGEYAHEGRVRIPPGSESEKRMTQWIKTGANRSGKPRILTHLELQPTETIVESVGTRIPLKAVARFDHGDPVDVTDWTVWTVEDPSSLVLDLNSHSVEIRRRGQQILLARYLDRVQAIRITVPLNDQRVDLSKQPRANFIDDEIITSWNRLRLPPSPRCDDATYLRRVALDLTGTLPTPERIEQFQKDQRPFKRERLVDELLSSEQFTTYFTYRLATLLRIRPQPNDAIGAKIFHEWIRDQLKSKRPFDQIAFELLTATGDTHKIGPANFSRQSGDARNQAERVSLAFLGIRLQCANCHNHPLDRWTQDDYHGLAAVFARLDRGTIVRTTTRGGVTNPRTGEPAVPRIPGSKYLDEQSDTRVEFSLWATSPENPFFAKAMVNRIWKMLMGRGLVDPVDDLRDTNPATHPKLLDRLANDFSTNGFQIRRTLKLIATSEAYTLSTKTIPGNRADRIFYSHFIPRSIEAEVLVDAISHVTGVDERLGSTPPGTRAIELTDVATPVPALDLLGRCARAASCDGDDAGEGLPAKLHLLNGPIINQKISSPKGRLHLLVQEGKTNQEIVTEFYLRALGRSPTKEETAYWNKTLDQHGDGRTEVLEDFLWSLLNTPEFIMNR